MIDATATGRFCWVDLAASDAPRAKAYYGALFGWQASDVPANGGSYTQLSQGGRAVVVPIVASSFSFSRA